MIFQRLQTVLNVLDNQNHQLLFLAKAIIQNSKRHFRMLREKPFNSNVTYTRQKETRQLSAFCQEAPINQAYSEGEVVSCLSDGKFNAKKSKGECETITFSDNHASLREKTPSFSCIRKLKIPEYLFNAVEVRTMLTGQSTR